MIMGTKVGQKHVRKQIDAFGTFDHHPDGMEIDPRERIYYKQYDLEYQIEGQRFNIKHADRLKLNLYFDPMRRSSELLDLDVAVKIQRQTLEKLLKDQIPLDDDTTIKRAYCYYKLEYNETTRLMKNFSLDEKKVARKKREAGFFANTTLRLNADPMTAQQHYKLRDEQEKYFHQMKGQMGFDKQQNWSEDGKQGRLLILFVALIISSYTKHIWKSTKLKKYFDSSLAVIDEMRPIRMIEHTGRARRITPFVGGQIDICEAFGFQIPPGCSPDYVSRKKEPKRRGRPKKPGVIHEEK
jgi:hypothetical protein